MGFKLLMEFWGHGSKWSWNKATVSKLTRVKIGTTSSSLELPWKIMGLDNKVRLMAGVNSELF